jgi:hypothetical protein
VGIICSEMLRKGVLCFRDGFEEADVSWDDIIKGQSLKLKRIERERE